MTLGGVVAAGWAIARRNLLAVGMRIATPVCALVRNDTSEGFRVDRDGVALETSIFRCIFCIISQFVKIASIFSHRGLDKCERMMYTKRALEGRERGFRVRSMKEITRHV